MKAEIEKHMEHYAARLFKSHKIAEMSGIRLKPYSIAATGREDIDMAPVLDAASAALAESGIPGMAHRGLGYLIYHAGEGANWLLTRVWMEGCIVSGLLDQIAGGQRVAVEEPFIECVWEEIIAHHERNAWVGNMMGAEENPAAYLADMLPEGMH